MTETAGRARWIQGGGFTLRFDGVLWMLADGSRNADGSPFERVATTAEQVLVQTVEYQAEEIRKNNRMVRK